MADYTAPLFTAAIAIPTRNRGPKLVRCLEHLAAQRYPDFSIIVADNGSTDDTPLLVRDFAARAAVPVHYVLEPARGGANARNHAIRIANAEIIAFVDDDCYPDPDWLAALMREFVDPRVGYAGGRLLLDDPTDAPFTISTSTLRFVRRAYEWTDGDDITGTGMAVRRKALERVGGYDPLLSPGTWFGAGEDLDMHSRLTGDGWDAVYTPDAVTYHGHGRKPGDPDLRRVERLYQYSRGAWYAKRALFGPHRWKTFRIAVSEARANARWITRDRVTGLLHYLRLVIPRLLRHGMAAVHPPIVPFTPTGPTS
jgi:GT2 family glycosyltransferase